MLTLVKLGNDWLNYIFKLLLLCLEGLSIGLGVGLEPRNLFAHCFLNFFLIRVAQFGTQLVLVCDLKWTKLSLNLYPNIEIPAGL